MQITQPFIQSIFIRYSKNAGREMMLRFKGLLCLICFMHTGPTRSLILTPRNNGTTLCLLSSLSSKTSLPKPDLAISFKLKSIVVIESSNRGGI